MKNIEMQSLYELFKGCSGVCTDSRKVEPNSLFFALKGENFDGNNYACGALESGASYAVIDSEELYQANGQMQERLILVDDVLTTLQQLARYNRLQYRLPVIALTGTNGKTTTKELITATLSTKYKVVSTIGNLNNHIGVPLTLLRINEETEVAVVEMGASAPGEINLLSSIVCPSFGLVTNVGKAHLLGFGSFEGVKATKGELYDNLLEHKKIAFVNVDNPNLMEMLGSRSDLRIVPYGVKNNCARIMDNSGESPFLKMVIPNPCLEAVCESGESGEIEVKTNLIGNYNADNVLAALCVATYFDVATADAVKAIENYIPSNNRSQMAETGRNRLIIDAYNANPTSMRASLENFSSMRSDNKSVVLGDMLELGADSRREHIEILKLVSGMGFTGIYLVGKEFESAFDEYRGGAGEGGSGQLGLMNVLCFADSQELARHFGENPVAGAAILIKGSRGTRLERIIEKL